MGLKIRTSRNECCLKLFAVTVCICVCLSIALATAALFVFLLLSADVAGISPLTPSLFDAHLGCTTSPALAAGLKVLSNATRRARTSSAQIELHRRRHRLVRVQIINSTLYVVCGARRPCFVHEARTIALLLQLVRLPDVDFLFSEAEQVCFHAPHVPIVAHETGDGCAHILAPPRALKSLPDAARWLSRASGVGIYAWEKRRQQAFFRGRQSGGALFDSNGEPSSIRAKVVDFGAKHPQLLDARFAGRGGSLRGAKAETAKRRNWSLDDAFLTWEEGLEYRATVVVDGNTVADRLAYLMASMTAIIKQESDRREALSSCMVPYVHYVPLKPDVSDLEEQITWALANETRLRQIAEAGAELVISHFSSVIERYRMSMAISVSSLADNFTTSVAVSM
mmetsp:Transcript_7176/g.15655  ORF Transcript_7176/g.15655 Transcript_7176/m.15655 type:complete len:396 (-) Transcript_7176:854-2041(-)